MTEDQPETKKVESVKKSFSKEEVEKYKGWAVVAYVLFFVPLLIDGAKESEYVKFHVKQGLLLFLAWIALSVVSGVLMIVLIGIIIAPLGGLFLLILWIMGIVNAINGKADPVPLIGQYAEEWFKF